MVNLEKKQNKRKQISLIKPQQSQTSAQTNNTCNIRSEPLSSEFVPRIKRPVYTRSQLEALNRHRVTYKVPNNYDNIPGTAPQNLNCPAISPYKQSLQQNQNTSKNLYIDTDAIREMVRVRKEQILNNNPFKNYSAVYSILVFLLTVFFIFLFFSSLSDFAIFALAILILLIKYFETKL